MARSCSVLVAALLGIVAIVSVAQAQAPDQETYLALHNAARSEVGVAALTWSDPAYSFANTWALTCALAHSPDGRPYGENLAWGTGLTATVATTLWTDEKVDYDYATNTCADVCGHYTQVVWNTTTSVGCASAPCSGGTIFHVCSYDPPGNINNGRPY